MSTETETPTQETNETPAEEGAWPKGDDNLEVEDIVHTDEPKQDKKSSKHHKSKKHKDDKKLTLDADAEVKISESSSADGASKKYSVNKTFKMADETSESAESTKPQDSGNKISEEKSNNENNLEPTEKVEEPSPLDESHKIENNEKTSKVKSVGKYTSTIVLTKESQSRDPESEGKIVTKITTTTYTCTCDKPIDKENIIDKLKAGEKLEGINVEIKEETKIKESDGEISHKTSSISKKDLEEDLIKLDQIGGETKIRDSDNEVSHKKTSSKSKNELKENTMHPVNKADDKEITHTEYDTDEEVKTDKEDTIDGNRQQDVVEKKEFSAEIDHVEMREKLENLDKEIEKLLKRNGDNALETDKESPKVDDKVASSKLENSDTTKNDLESTLLTMTDETDYRPRRRRAQDEDTSEDTVNAKNGPNEDDKNEEKIKKTDDDEYVPSRRQRNISPSKTEEDSHSTKSKIEEDEYIPRRRRREIDPDKTDHTTCDTSRSRRVLSPSKTEGEEDNITKPSESRKLSDTSNGVETDYKPRIRKKEDSPTESVDTEPLPKSRRKKTVENGSDAETSYISRSRLKDASPVKSDNVDTSPRSRRTRITPDRNETSDYVPRSRRTETSPDKENGYTSRRQRRELSPKVTYESDYTPRSRRREHSPIAESKRRISPVKRDTDEYIPRSRRKNLDKSDDDQVSTNLTSYDTSSRYEPSPNMTYAAPSYSSVSTKNKTPSFNSYQPSSKAYSAYSSYKPSTCESPLTKAKNDYFSMDSYYPGKYSSAPRGERTLGVDPLSIKSYIYEATTGDPCIPKKEPSDFESRYAKYLRESTPKSELKPKPLYDLERKTTTSPLKQSGPHGFDPIYKSGPLLRQPSPKDWNSWRARQSSPDYVVPSRSPARKPDNQYDYDGYYKPYTRSVPSDTYTDKPLDYASSYHKPPTPLDLDDYKTKLRSIYQLDTNNKLNDDDNDLDTMTSYKPSYKSNHLDGGQKPTRSYDVDTPSKYATSSSYNSSDRLKRYDTYDQHKTSDCKEFSDYNTKYGSYIRGNTPSNNTNLRRDDNDQRTDRRSANSAEELLSTSVMPLSEYVMSQRPRVRDDGLDYLNLSGGTGRYDQRPQMSYQASLNYGRPSHQPAHDSYSYLRRNITPHGDMYRNRTYTPSPYNQYPDSLTTPHLRRPYMPIFSQEAALVKRAHHLINKIVADTKAGDSSETLSGQRNHPDTYQIPRRF